MVTIPNFETEMLGKTFVESTSINKIEYVCMGYGDNQGTPYLIGMTQSPNGAAINTILLRNVTFVKNTNSVP